MEESEEDITIGLPTGHMIAIMQEPMHPIMQGFYMEFSDHSGTALKDIFEKRMDFSKGTGEEYESFHKNDRRRDKSTEWRRVYWSSQIYHQTAKKAHIHCLRFLSM